MIEKIDGIIIDLIKHSDTYNVVTLFTRSRGRMALLSPAGASRSARMRNASLQPLSVIQTDINFNQKNSLQRLGQFSSPLRWRDIYFNPYKSAITLFISEFLNRYLFDAAPEPLLWDFTINAIRRLDESGASCANFHIAFLIRLLSIAGIEPPLSELQTDDWFDMRKSEFTPYRPPHADSLPPQEAAAMPMLARMNFRNYHRYRMSREQRQELLSQLLKYYAIHFPPIASMKSPAVLRELFST